MIRTHGFTLLELIVVIAIFGVFSLMAYGGLNSVLKTRQQVEQSLERTAQFQKAYQRLRNDFQQVRNRTARDGFGDTQPPLRGGRDGRIEFTRGGWRNPLQLPRPGLERVSYRLAEKKLLRESWRVLDQAQDSKVVALTLLEHVEDLRLRYLGVNRVWSEVWPAENLTGQTQAASSAPLAVELSLQTKDWGEVKFLFRLGMDTPPSGYRPGSLQNPNERSPNQTPGPGLNPPPTQGDAPSTGETRPYG